MVVQRSALSLDHPDNEIDGMVVGNLADEFAVASRHFESVLKESAKDLTTLRGADADADAEIMAFGITADERLRENDNFGPGSARI